MDNRSSNAPLVLKNDIYKFVTIQITTAVTQIQEILKLPRSVVFIDSENIIPVGFMQRKEITLMKYKTLNFSMETHAK